MNLRNGIKCVTPWFSGSMWETYCLFLLLFVTSVYAQNTGKISGIVLDAKTKQPLPSVNVAVRGTTLGAVTDIDGKYFILNIPPGMYKVAASIIGFQGVVQENVVVNINRTTALNFSLQETVVETQEMVITATRPDVEKEKTSTSEIRRLEDIQNVPIMQNITDVISLSSDVSDGHFRGGRTNEELYNLQGMGIMNPLSSTSAFVPIMSAVEEVEIITSGFGAQYGNAQSGVVNITMKEGRQDKWIGRAEARTRIPGLKHFGPSVFDPSVTRHRKVNDSTWVDDPVYLASLDTYSDWLDSTNTSSFAEIAALYGRDKATQAQVLYSLYVLEGHRDIGRRYDNLQDYSADVHFGGPLATNTRMFTAFHVEKTWPLLPTPEPNSNMQFMGNLVYELGKGMTFRLSGAYAKQKTHRLSGVSGTGWMEWLWDRVFGVPVVEEDNLQLGARWAHTLNAGTFYEIKVNTLQTTSLEGSPVTDPNYLAISGSQKPFWISTWQPNPDGFSSFGKLAGNFNDEKTGTISLDASITSQVTSSHMLMAGLQANHYTIEVDDRSGVDNSSGGMMSKYTAEPYEAGLFVQDKMEFQGMIANVGLRLDIYNPNTTYYVNEFAPFDYYDTLGLPHHYEPQAPRERTKVVSSIQPRLGFSFPAALYTVFHVNYGTFMQRPSFDQILSHTFSRKDVYDNNGGASSVPQDQVLGNPQLEPEVNNSYDVGVAQGFGDGFTLDVSGYYKDVKHLVQKAMFAPASAANVRFLSYVNLEYADIRGFRVGLTKRKGMLTGTLSYTYGVTTGKRSSADAFRYPTLNEVGEPTEPLPKDVYLDFDRTHNVVANLAFTTPENWGPMVAGARMFDQLTIAATSFIRSGRPYTSWLNPDEPMNRRAPNEATTNLKITKVVSGLWGTNVTVYLEVSNLFNDKIYNYDALFNKNLEGVTSTDLTRFGARYERGEDVTFYDNEYLPKFIANQEFRIYSNSPRSWMFGMVVNF